MPHRYCVCNAHLCNDYSSRSPFPSSYPIPPSGYTQSKSRSVGLPKYFFAVIPFRDFEFFSRHFSPSQKFYECVNCDLTAEDSSVTSSCKQNRCMGHFCIYATQRLLISSASARGNGVGSPTHAILHEKQGCINVTDSHQVSPFRKIELEFFKN